MKHTQGKLTANATHLYSVALLGNTKNIRGTMAVIVTNSEDYDRDINDTKRLADCWNALVGVKDPEGLIRNIRGAIDALDMEDGLKANQKGADHLNAIREHLKGGE